MFLATCLGERENNRQRGHESHKGTRSQMTRAVATARRAVTSTPPARCRCVRRARKSRSADFFFTRFVARGGAISRARAVARSWFSLAPSFVRWFVRWFVGSFVRSKLRFFDRSIFRCFDCSILRFFDLSIVRSFDRAAPFGVRFLQFFRRSLTFRVKMHSASSLIL